MHETRGDRRLPEPVPSPCAAGRGPGAGSTMRRETPPLSVVFNWGYTKRPTCSARAERTLCKENRALRHIRSSRDHAAARCAPGPHAGRSGVGVDLRAPGVDLGGGGWSHLHLGRSTGLSSEGQSVEVTAVAQGQ